MIRVHAKTIDQSGVVLKSYSLIRHIALSLIMTKLSQDVVIYLE